MDAITRISTPAVLMTTDDDLFPLSTITDRAAYRENHGYLPVPYCDHAALFKDSLPVKLFSQIKRFGNPGAFLSDDGAFEIQIDLVSRKELPPKLLPSLKSVATDLLLGPLGDDITASTAIVTGISIVCVPVAVRVTSLTVKDLLSEFRHRLDTLNANRAFGNLNERAGLYSAVCWLARTLEIVLPSHDAERIRTTMQSIEGCRIRHSSPMEVEICAKLYKHFKL